MDYQGFVFSDETSSLNDEEFNGALDCLAQIEDAINLRDHRSKSDPEAAIIFNPDAGWHPKGRLSIEPDGGTKNGNTSYDLLTRADREIISKMRLYSQVFTGHQLATLEGAGIRPWIAEKLPRDWDNTLRYLAGPPTASVKNYISLAYALPPELRIVPPRKFGEIGWMYDNVIINDDAYGYQQLFSLMYENGLIEMLMDRLKENGCLRIVEIGGGYGALAYYLIRLFGHRVHYMVVDIPESLAFSSIYCRTLLPDMSYRFIGDEAPFSLGNKPGLTFVPNTLYKNLSADDGSVDLCLNTLSLAEMSLVQIEDYLASISRFIGSTGIFFEQNHQNNAVELGEQTPRYLKNMRRCETNLVPTYPQRRGQANIWVNANFNAEITK